MEIPQYEYMVGVKHVKYSTQENDLGVEIDNKLSFDQHIQEKVKKANMMTGWVRRSFQYMNKFIFNMLYKSPVRSPLEYAAPVWNGPLTLPNTCHSSKSDHEVKKNEMRCMSFFSILTIHGWIRI